MDTADKLKGKPRQEQIAVQSHFHFGKPCVAGTRVTVQSVLELVREGNAAADIRRDYYPDLAAEDVRTCSIPTT